MQEARQGALPSYEGGRDLMADLNPEDGALGPPISPNMLK
jgi:hypothetical protein